MPKVRKRKRPVTSPAFSSASTSSAHTRSLIRRYHVLLKQKTHLLASESCPTTKSEIAEIDVEIREMGGLEKYQAMSVIGQSNDRGGGSEKVLIKWLKSPDAPKEKSKIRLLEVGALAPDNYSKESSWIEVTPIDLHSRHPSILEQDFLLMDRASNIDKWDVISLSLVLNFAPAARDRGRMLVLAHSFLRSSGFLYLVLPLPCVQNSRYLTMDYLEALMKSIGFSLLKQRWKPGGKLAYWLFQKSSIPPATSSLEKWSKKTVLLDGPHRNNFTILL